jgi:hypothetical protein
MSGPLRPPESLASEALPGCRSLGQGDAGRYDEASDDVVDHSAIDPQ